VAASVGRAGGSLKQLEILREKAPKLYGDRAFALTYVRQWLFRTSNVGIDYRWAEGYSAISLRSSAPCTRERSVFAGEK
jgi:hypothetical protein